MAADETQGPAETLLFRLRDARYVVGAAILVTLVLVVTSAGFAGWLIGSCVIVASVFLPRRSRLERVADERRRVEKTEVSRRMARDAVLEGIDVPAFLLTGDIAVVHANSAAKHLFGPVSEGTHLSARIRSPGILDMVREAVAEGEANTIEHCERFPSERWYIVRVAPLPEVADAAGLFVLTFQDITEARRMDRMRSDFVANASHELRTPLASLTGFIETLQGPARGDPEAVERFLGIMLEQAERMSRLIEDLMSLSRLELRANVAPDGRIALGRLLGHVCEALRPLAGELGVTIRYGAPEKEVFISGDRDELIQVFQNLIENACKYGQSGAFVDVGIRLPDGGAGTPDGMVDIAIRDYGPGIPSEHVPRLTERFYRVSAETSRSKKGTGLGLAIVKHILTRHRARLIVHSEPGRGSVFVCRFRALSTAEE